MPHAGMAFAGPAVTAFDRIEVVKENVQPLKRGRDAGRTATALGLRATGADSLEQQRACVGVGG